MALPAADEIPIARAASDRLAERPARTRNCNSLSAIIFEGRLKEDRSLGPSFSAVKPSQLLCSIQSSESRQESRHQTAQHYGQLIEVLAPQGRFASIDDPATLDAMPLKRKSISLHWEMMFTRPLFETPDMQRQHDILNRVSELVNAGTIRTTLAEHFGRIDAANLRRADVLIESGHSKGGICARGLLKAKRCWPERP